MEEGNHGSALLEKIVQGEVRIEHGLLIDFGGQKFQIKNYILSKDA